VDREAKLAPVPFSTPDRVFALQIRPFLQFWDRSRGGKRSAPSGPILAFDPSGPCYLPGYTSYSGELIGRLVFPLLGFLPTIAHSALLPSLATSYLVEGLIRGKLASTLSGKHALDLKPSSSSEHYGA
jgi:hypothetical protein